MAKEYIRIKEEDGERRRKLKEEGRWATEAKKAGGRPFPSSSARRTEAPAIPSTGISTQATISAAAAPEPLSGSGDQAIVVAPESPADEVVQVALYNSVTTAKHLANQWELAHQEEMCEQKAKVAELAKQKRTRLEEADQVIGKWSSENKREQWCAAFPPDLNKLQLNSKQENFFFTMRSCN